MLKKYYANEIIKLIDLNTRNFEQINIDYSRLITYSINLENENKNLTVINLKTDKIENFNLN